MSRSTETEPGQSWTNSVPEPSRSQPRLRLLDFDNPSRSDVVIGGLYIFLFALAARVTFVIYDGGFGYEPKADSQDFHMIAVSLANGTGYSRLYPDLTWRPTAYRMPLTPLVLAGIYKSFGVSPFTARVILAVAGAMACSMLVLAATSALGRSRGLRAGLVAGFLAAADPFLVMNQTLILLEPLHVLLVASLIVSSLSYARAPQVWKLWAMAAVGALLTLNRPDGFSYALLAAAVAVIASRQRKRGFQAGPDDVAGAELSMPDTDEISLLGSDSSGLASTTSTAVAERFDPWENVLLIARRLAPAGLILGVTAVTLVPWTVRNYRSLGAFVPLTTASGDLLLGANNQATYSPGPFFGYWAYGALTTGEAGAYGFAGEVRADRERRRLALEYAYRHPLGATAVIPIRILRGWDLFDPIGNARFGEAWGRPKALSLLALALYYPGLALAVWGALLYRRMWRELSILYLLPAYLTILFAVATGEPRYRSGIQLVVWLFAGMGAVRLLKKRQAMLSQSPDFRFNDV